ncbi:sugar phosphate isomerase/epimerase family protein [Flavobacterium fluviatile]|uniref:sugar phosphate isomerase/epimerase family protein n=1 Tax=Flavobacterium fluviatile TaxID=1862387 RepID=UPI0013D8193D|nr:TIM barrel protein [Flavobacterium fluviatile]
MTHFSQYSRRNFIKLSSLAAIGLIPVISNANSFLTNNFKDDSELDVSIFSKHLQFLDYKNTGEMAAEMGFSGVDLTVRPNGHVLPELVKTDLPLAIKAIKKAGSDCKMISTNIESITNQLDVDIITAAAGLDIKYYRTNWFKYKEQLSMNQSLLFYQKEIEKLAQLNATLGITGCYQNHDGRSIGSSFWETDTILKTADPAYFCSQFDIRHAMVEGGNSWQNGFELLKDKIKVIALKDYKWQKNNGKWKAIHVPIGEGMVDFDMYFKLLKKNHLKPPVSLHLEYDLGGAEKGNKTISVDKKVVFDAMKKDLTSIQKLWREA